MKSFRESLTITKNYKLLEQLIVELDYLGVAPNKFLDWYLSEGILLYSHNLLSEGFDDWAIKEGIFSSIFDRWTQGRNEKEKQNLDNEFPDYERAGQKIGSYAQKGGEFLGNQVARARGRYSSLLRGITGNTSNTSNTTPQPPSLSNSAAQALEELSKRYHLSRDLKSAVGDENFGRQIMQLFNKVKSLKENALIENKLFILSSKGLDIEFLVEWYAEERLNIQEGIGSWFQKAGNWLGGQWQNLKHAVRNWGEGDKNAAAQKDKRAVDNALAALNQLRSKYGDTVDEEFSSLLNAILNKVEDIHSVMNTKGSTQSLADTEKNTQYSDDPSSRLGVPGTGSSDVGSFGLKSSTPQRFKGKFVKPFGTSSSQVEPNSSVNTSAHVGTNSHDYTSTFGDSQEYKDQKSFMESIVPKSNKFSWFGY